MNSFELKFSRCLSRILILLLRSILSFLISTKAIVEYISSISVVVTWFENVVDCNISLFIILRIVGYQQSSLPSANVFVTKKSFPIYLQ